MATSTEHNPEQKPEGQEQSASRRALIRAGWAIPVVLAAMTPANVFAAVSNPGSGSGSLGGGPFKKKGSGANAAATQPRFSLLDQEIRKMTGK